MSQEEPETEAARWQAEVSEVYGLAVSTDRTFRMVGYILVNSAVSAKIQAATGSEVSDYKHVVDTDTVRHILKTHGRPSETSRGQIPLVKDDFLKLLNILTEPDTVTDAGLTKQGLKTVLYTKCIGAEDFFFVQGIESGRKRLRPVTMYKRKRKP